MLAAMLMVIDHLGVIYPDHPRLRLIGRLAFPLFAWLLVQGVQHTRHWQKYFRRLCIFAIIAQPGLMLLNPQFQLNILCLFFLALPLVRFKNELNEPQNCLFWALVAAIAEYGQVSYGAYGIGMIGIFTLRKELNEQLWLTLWILLNLYGMYAWGTIQGFTLCFYWLLPTLENIQERGPRARWFYWFYPLHFLPLTLLKTL